MMTQPGSGEQVPYGDGHKDAMVEYTLNSGARRASKGNIGRDTSASA